MKKIIFILMAIVAVGCKSIDFTKSNIRIGMTEEEFKQRFNKKTELVSANADGTTIYRTHINRLYQGPQPYAFFVFNKGKLSHFEKSEYVDDYGFTGQ